MDYSRLTTVNCNDIMQKAKTKANGIYRFRGIAYRVRDHNVTHYATLGQISESFGSFIVKVGDYEGRTDIEAQAALKKITG